MQWHLEAPMSMTILYFSNSDH